MTTLLIVPWVRTADGTRVAAVGRVALWTAVGLAGYAIVGTGVGLHRNVRR